MRTATVTAPRRPRVTAAFLKHSDGYCHDGLRLLRVVRPPLDSNARDVLVEDCYTLKAEDVDRAAMLKMRVVKWPAALD